MKSYRSIYKGVFGVIWNETLCNVYQDEWALENKISQLMGF
ncbi:DUF1367 family protein [Haemophilus parahaemolyticus]|nr:DUF1367 family protein [Haemophilus parahaemolyticus]